MVGIIIDILIVAFLALSVFLGYKKGFVSLAIKLCAFLIAILITFVLYRPLGNLIINTTSIDESIEDPKKQLQMIVLEDIYYSVSSVIKLKFVDGKWHFLTELNRYDIVQDGLLYDFCMCDKWYPYASKEKENDRKEKSKLNDKVILKELFEFFEQLRITDEENSIIREKDPTGFLEAIEIELFSAMALNWIN